MSEQQPRISEGQKLVITQIVSDVVRDAVFRSSRCSEARPSAEQLACLAQDVAQAIVMGLQKISEAS